MVTALTDFKSVLFKHLSTPPINLCGKWDSNSRYFWVEIRYYNQLGDYRILWGYTDSNCNHLSQNQEYCHYTISHFVGVIGFERTCNHLLFLLLIRERRYTPIFLYLWRDSNPYACAPDPKSGLSSNSSTEAYLREEWESNPFKRFCRSPPISTGPLPL